MVPASGATNPSTHFSSTDLPVPDPPMITMLCPLGIVKSTPRKTRLGPKDLCTPDKVIMM